MPPEPVLLTGQRHPEYGTFSARRVGPRTSAFLSAGAGGQTPALLAKGDPSVPNEDALLALDDGERVLLAVADGHWGHEASHDVVEWLADALDGVPRAAPELEAVLRRMSERHPEATYRSRTTFVVAAFDRASGLGFGVSYGDSSFAVAAPGGAVVVCNPRARSYISPANPPSLAPERGAAFTFDARPGALLLAFTDGIDECHYGQPETSVTPAVMAALLAESGSDPAFFGERLVQTALAGVGGNPGGQDNIALVVTRA